MHRSNIYPKMILLVSFFVLAFNSVFAQDALQLKLQLLEPNKWGVYVRPAPTMTIHPGSMTITGTAQVTLVMPKDYAWTGLTSVNGSWSNTGSTVNGPIENPTRKYVSIGWNTDFPPINYVPGQETLLFTFQGDGNCPDSMYLIDNATDPFNQLPNSMMSNPGNELTVFDPDGGENFAYLNNYAPSAWSCHDCDGDGVLNAFEDTDGNGTYNATVEADIDGDGYLDHDEDIDGDGHWDNGEDANNNGVLDVGEDVDGDGVLDLSEDLDGDHNFDNVSEDTNGNGVLNAGEDDDGDGHLDLGLEDLDGDGNFDEYNEDYDGDGKLDTNEDLDSDGFFDPDVSQICNPCDPYHPESAELVLIGGADVICAGDVGDTAWFQVNIVGGWPPYTVNYTDGTTTYQETLYYSGDSISFVPTASVSLELTSIVDSFNCLLDTALGAPIDFSVHGPISVTNEPDNVTECYGNSTQYCIATQNLGDGYVYKKWQVSTNSGGSWADIQDGGVYDNTDSLCLSISNVANKNNYQYRCKIFTDVCDTVYSNAAYLHVEGPLSITTNPSDFVNCDNEDATFTAAAQKAPGSYGTLAYQWQYSTNGSDFYDLGEGDTGGPSVAHYTNVTAGTLNIDQLDVSQDGWYYRMKVSTGTCDTVFTTAARLNISGPITVEIHPQDYSNCAGNEVFFATQFHNAGSLYPADSSLTITNFQWQVSTNGGATYSNISNSSSVYNGVVGTDVYGWGYDTLAITDVTGLNGNYYRICYTSATCSTPVCSNGALLEVSGNVAFTDDPDDITVCSGGDTTFTATASIPQGSFTFGWEYSTDNGLTWHEIDFVAEAATFSHTQTTTISSGTDVLTVSNVAGMLGRRFRAVAHATDCNDVYSAYAILSVEGPLVEDVVPVSVVECSGNPTSFTASYTNTGLAGSTIYQWQVSTNGGATWSNVSGYPYAGVSSTTLTILNVAGLHNYRYRISARTSTCNIVFGTSALLTVEGPITVTTQPVSVDLCSEESTSFTSLANVGTAGTFTYQWQVSSGGGVWNDITATTDQDIPGGINTRYTGINTTTLNVTNVRDLYNRCYRLAFSTGECLRVYSDPACLNIDGPIAVSDHPDDIIQCSEEAVLFGIEATNGSLEADAGSQIHYMWQQNSTGDTTSGWTNISAISQADTLFTGFDTDTLAVLYTAGLSGNYYRVAIWTDECAVQYSYAAMLQLEGPITVTQEPSSISECSGSGVTFQSTVSMANGDPGTLMYQWEYSTDNGVTWGDVPSGGVYSGETTTTLSISDVAGMYGWRFRMRFRTPNCNADWTNYAILTVEGPIGFGTGGHPEDVVACSNTPAVFCVQTTNDSTTQINYQWQALLPGADSTVALNWANLNNSSIMNGTKTACLSVSNIAGFNGYRFRVLISTLHCSSTASNTALLTVEGPIVIDDHPDPITQCSGEDVDFTGAAHITAGNSGTLIYQWQRSDDATCTNFTNITAAGAAGYSGWNTPTLHITNVAGLTGICYRLNISTATCNVVSTFSAKLTVEGPLTITKNPDPITNCSDKEAIFVSKVTNPGVGGVDAVYKQWQYSSNGGATWTDITMVTQTIGGNVINFSGAETDTLLITPITGLNGYLFRNNFWTATCNLQSTTAAILNVEGPISFTDQPDDVTLCSGSSTCFTVAINTTTAVGTAQYQWQRFVAGSWVNLSNASPYSGVFTNQMCISDVAGLYNNKFRCRVKTANCEWVDSDLANLFVEGPITVNLQPVDATICSNKPQLFNTTITNLGYGQMTYRWQYLKPGGSWTSFPTNIGDLSSLGVFNPTDPNAKWQSAFNQDINFTNTDGLDGWMFRLLITTPHCSHTTNEVTITVLDKCLSGDCDLDGDGDINSVDTDDDNDQLADFWEQWTTDNNLIVNADLFPGTGPWNYTVYGGAYDVTTNPYISYDRCLVDTDGDGFYDNEEDPDQDNINNGEETDGDIIFDGNPLDPCNPVLGPTCIGINLAIRVGLQGAHIGVVNSDTLMRATLRSYGPNSTNLVPLVEPYEAMASFAHNGPDGGGTEEIASQDVSTIFGKTDKDAIVDWVFVELRSSTALDSVATSRSGLLQRDGDVVDLDGVSNLRFPNAAAGTYYVAVRHRNHLGVMTGEALDLSPALQEIDFMDPSFVVSGTYPQIQLGSKRYMWAGDLNSDGRVVYQGPGNDVLKLFTTVLYDPANTSVIANFISQGYQVSDVNLDGRSIYQGPNNDRSMVLLNAILAHPANNNLIANFVIIDALP